MQRYEITTLVDITRSQPTRAETDFVKIGQQNNFNSLIQAIGLRANMSWTKDPECIDGRLPDPFEGKATHWIWQFEVERDEVFMKGNDPVGLLIDDLNGVPIIANLKNTVELNPPIFKTIGPNPNTSIRII